jgi:cobalt/nickel transport system permease protein
VDWLFKDDDYKPEGENSKYIGKSISSILKVISVVKNSYNNKGGSGLIYMADPSIKLCSTLMIVLLLALSRGFAFVLFLDIALVLLCLWHLKSDFMRPLILSIIISCFSIVVLIPSILMGNTTNSILLVFKVFGAAGYSALLSSTSRWDDIGRALKIFFIPDIFIFTMDTTLKYINILGESALDMFYAMRVRNIGKNNKKYMGLSAVGGNLFLKSKEMSEEMYMAMECRGFTGEYAANKRLKLSQYDFIYILLNIAVFTIFVWQEVIR